MTDDQKIFEFGVEQVSCHPSGTQNFEVVPEFKDNLSTLGVKSKVPPQTVFIPIY